jgi:hypothetical protein
MRSFLPALVALLALAAPAAAAPTRLGTSLRLPLVDSAASRVVWQPDAGSIRVLDLRSGVPARPLGLPAGCVPGQSGALRGDRLVLTCHDGNRVLDVRSGASGPVPGAAAAGIGGPDSGVLSVGRVWAEGFDDDLPVFFTLDGLTAETSFGTARTLPDLDSTRLWRRMCAPLRRSPDELYDSGPGFLPYAYSPPLGHSYRLFDYRPLRVDRCGHERSLRLSRCRRACTAVHLGAGSIAWRERGRIRLYRGASRRRGHWRARGFGRLAEPVPTRRHVVVTAGRYGAYSVWSVRAPT